MEFKKIISKVKFYKGVLVSIKSPGEASIYIKAV